MFDNDQVTDSAELRALRDSLTGLAMPGRPSLAAIKARGRVQRRRRLPGAAGLLVAAAAAGAALALGVVGVIGRGDVRNPTRAPTPGTIRTPSYTLVSDSSGKVTLTIDPRKLFDAAALQSDLARYGIPAKVTEGRFCSSQPAPAGLHKVVSTTRGGGGVPPTVSFDPSAIPAGTELSFGHFQLTGFQFADVALMDTGSHTCSSTVPTGQIGHMQVGYFLLPPGQATSHG
jgi:hypothetical protein